MGVTLFTNVDIGEIPPTPAQPYFDGPQLETARKTLLAHAFSLGYPISFSQEQSGALVQNILPVHKTEYEQISTSSKVQLALHTETAFHPHKPDYVMLLCLRGDPSAITTYANIEDIIKLLDQEMIIYLQDYAYSTGVDQSFKKPDKKYKETTLCILKKIKHDEYKFTYDEDLMKPINIFASMAMDKLSEAISKCVKEVVLKTGDLLIIDNNKTIHGRKPFQPRYDGTDRWVQRMLVSKVLPPMSEMQGHTVTTSFEE